MNPNLRERDMHHPNASKYPALCRKRFRESTYYHKVSSQSLTRRMCMTKRHRVFCSNDDAILTHNDMFERNNGTHVDGILARFDWLQLGGNLWRECWELHMGRWVHIR